MKKALLLGFVCFSSFCYSQTEDSKVAKDTLAWTQLTCEKGTEEAEADFKKGIYNSYSYGWAAEVSAKDEEGFPEFYKKYVREKYSINIEHKGCMVSDYSECYSEIMEKLISKKFGATIYAKARKEALKLFAKKQK